MHRLQDQTDVFAAGNYVINPAIQACPSCEYERASPGKPVSRDGKMRCMDCGSSWKVFGSQASRLERIPEALPWSAVSFQGPVVEFSPSPADPIPANSPGYKKSGLHGLLICGFLLIAGVGLMLTFFASNPDVPANGGLHVANVEFEELVRGDLGKVVRVKGTISNIGASSERVPRIALVLKKTNGSVLTRWYYNSPVVKLAPGGKTRFVSSIQYDTPVIASVEALLE
ncbi:MAG: hypothetical protein ACR2O3_17045 [Rhizobiaceae bacterium]